MKRKYLGDSFDAVKRMWQDMLSGWAPLYAEPRFIPHELRAEFTQLTRIPMLPEKPIGEYSILNDPDTGIRLPDEANQAEGLSHIAINSIVRQLRNGAQCIVTFDQSHYRNRGPAKREQREAKRISLAEKGVHSFYYVSHAPFLFAARDVSAFHRVVMILENGGIPKNRFEMIENASDGLIR